MIISARKPLRFLLLGTVVSVIGGCSDPLDWDLRRGDGMLNTAPAAQRTLGTPPAPDDRGVITYPTYQAAMARRGDTVADLAARVGMSPEAVASYNGISPSTRLRSGEILVLPGGAGAAGVATAGDSGAGSIDITTLASGAIDRAEAAQLVGTIRQTTAPNDLSAGVEPARHRVERGETAYSIARQYNVTPRALSQWNGLGPDLAVREGQMLMIPPTAAAASAATTAPGQGTPTPVPPSASKPLPGQTPAAANRPAPATPASPNLAETRTRQSQLAMPVSGAIIREYAKGKNEGIDIGAPAGTQVRAAEEGTVAAITKDTDQMTILVLRHKDNLLTVYANIDNLKVAKGGSVKRGQTLGTVRPGSPSFVHFEVRRGFESVDPMPYLK